MSGPMENRQASGNHVPRTRKRAVSECTEVSKEDEAAGVEALLECREALPARLPSVEQVKARRKTYAGPTDESNWVLPGRLLVGAYPAEVEDDEHEQVLQSILRCGVTTFVCLQKEYDHASCDREAWRSGAQIRPYISDAYRLCKERRRGSANEAICQAEQLAFLHTPIADCDVTSDRVVRDLAEALCWRLLAGEVLYVHCWGGHGRTGTLVAVMLGMLYKISTVEALKRTQLYHDLRSCNLHVPSPQTFAQRMQVLRILQDYEKEASLVELHRANSSLCLDPARRGESFTLPIDTEWPDEAEPSSSAKMHLNPLLDRQMLRKRRKVVGSLRACSNPSGKQTCHADQPRGAGATPPRRRPLKAPECHSSSEPCSYPRQTRSRVALLR